MTHPASAPPRAVAVTGAAGYIGGRLVERLLAEGVERVVGVDVRPARIEHERYTHLEQDICSPLDVALHRHGVEAIVHLAFVLRQTRRRAQGRRVNVEGGNNVLWAAHAAGVRRIVLMSSATLYGPSPEHTAPVDENAPVRPPRGFAYAEDKAETERAFLRYAQSRAGEVDVSILRGCIVMGPNAANFITAALDRPVLVRVGGQDPPMQFVHEDDVVELLWRFVAEPHPGVFNVAAPGTVRWSEMVAAAGRRLISLPAWAIYPLTQLAWLAHLQNDAPAVGLDFIRWPWTVSTARLEAELGFTFTHDSRAALNAYLATLGRGAAPEAPGEQEPGEQEPGEQESEEENA
jgi:UDP-glucose 4-epimerase